MTIADRQDADITVSVTDIRLPPMVVERIEVGVPNVPVGAIGLGVYGTVRRVKGGKIPFGPTTQSIQLATMPLWILGWSIRETTGTAYAQFDLHDSVGSGGDLLAAITLADNESTRDYLTEPWLPAESGVYLDMLAGEIKGSLWIVVPDEGEKQ